MVVGTVLESHPQQGKEPHPAPYERLQELLAFFRSLEVYNTPVVPCDTLAASATLVRVCR
jgi:hypothetical protein